MEDFAPGQVSGRGSGGVMPVSHGEDSALIVEFMIEPELNNAKSREAGRNIFDDREYVWIRFPGDRNREVKRRVDHMGKNGNAPDSVRFPVAWARFQNKQTVVSEGTPLEQWPIVTRATVLSFKGLNIHTVENLASVPDSALHNIGQGARELRDKAQAWLKSAEGNAELMALRDENETLRNDLEALKDQVAALSKPKPRRKKAEAA